MNLWIEEKYIEGLASVIIPTYNRRDLLHEAILSVVNQTYRPIECVVVDDGSQDDTSEWMEQWIELYHTPDFTIKYIQKENGGAPSARNLGTENSTGEFIQYLDSDDVLYPEKIKTQADFLKITPTCDGVFGDWHHGTEEEHDLIHGVKTDQLIAQFYGGRVIHTLSFLFRRSMVNKVGPWDIKLKRNQEVDFNLRAVLAKGNFQYQPLLTGLWREHPGERIVTSNGAKYALQFHRKWIDNFKTMGIFDAHLKSVAANHLFVKTLDLKADDTTVLETLYEVDELNPQFNYFNTGKMKLMKHTIGRKKAIQLWYKKYKKSKNLQ